MVFIFNKYSKILRQKKINNKVILKTSIGFKSFKNLYFGFQNVSKSFKNFLIYNKNQNFFFTYIENYKYNFLFFKINFIIYLNLLKSNKEILRFLIYKLKILKFLYCFLINLNKFNQKIQKNLILTEHYKKDFRFFSNFAKKARVKFYVKGIYKKLAIEDSPDVVLAPYTNNFKLRSKKKHNKVYTDCFNLFRRIRKKSTYRLRRDFNFKVFIKRNSRIIKKNNRIISFENPTCGSFFGKKRISLFKFIKKNRSIFIKNSSRFLSGRSFFIFSGFYGLQYFSNKLSFFKSTKHPLNLHVKRYNRLRRKIRNKHEFKRNLVFLRWLRVPFCRKLIFGLFLRYVFLFYKKIYRLLLAKARLVSNIEDLTSKFIVKFKRKFGRMVNIFKKIKKRFFFLVKIKGKTSGFFDFNCVFIIFLFFSIIKMLLKNFYLKLRRNNRLFFIFRVVKTLKFFQFMANFKLIILFYFFIKAITPNLKVFPFFFIDLSFGKKNYLQKIKLLYLKFSSLCLDKHRQKFVDPKLIRRRRFIDLYSVSNNKMTNFCMLGQDSLISVSKKLIKIYYLNFNKFFNLNLTSVLENRKNKNLIRFFNIKKSY